MNKYLSYILSLVNFSPFIKRLFWWQPEIYYAISGLAVLCATRKSLNINRLIISVFLMIWVSLVATPERAFLLYAPFLFIWIFSPSLSYETVLQSFWSLRYLFLVSLLYALIQKLFGYLPFELNWINSDLGTVRAEGYFVTNEVRPFSFYAGSPEFGLFSTIIMYTSFKKRNFPFLLLGLVGVYLAGSRGVMVSVLISICVVVLPQKLSPKLRVSMGFICAVFAYLFLAIVLPLTGFLEAKNDSSRLLIYGTFNYRVIMLINLISHADIYNIWYGIGTDKNIFDNFYLTLLNDVGIFGILSFLPYIFFRIKSEMSVFFAVFILSYCMYSDAVFSIYMMYNILVILNVKVPQERTKFAHE